jgi:hypothetical protein
MTIHSPDLRVLEDDGGTERTFSKIVHHGGRDFLATEVMASIFSARAQDVIARHDTELVPLLHKDGVELLLIGPDTVFAVVNARTGVGSTRAGASRSS